MVELKPCQRVEACIADVMERFPTDSKDYYVEVHQHLAPLARRLERDLDEAKAELARRATPPSPSTAPTVEADERAAFEAWCRNACGMTDGSLEKSGDRYRMGRTADMWATWKSRAALAAKPAAPQDQAGRGEVP